uniref:Uncharacterized protein n=1 Tax=Timema poppense TaxID=170557 RepID=A0A7R9DVI2_TIMPO|nr:unnamed protein product [Timema poppensis]
MMSVGLICRAVTARGAHPLVRYPTRRPRSSSLTSTAAPIITSQYQPRPREGRTLKLLYWRGLQRRRDP